MEHLIQEISRNWIYEWNEFEDIADDIREKIEEAHEQLVHKCSTEFCASCLQISLEWYVIRTF